GDDRNLESLPANRPAQVDVVGVEGLDARHDGDVVKTVGWPQAGRRRHLKHSTFDDMFTDSSGHSGNSWAYKSAPESHSRGALTALTFRRAEQQRSAHRILR